MTETYLAIFAAMVSAAVFAIGVRQIVRLKYDDVLGGVGWIILTVSSAPMFFASVIIAVGGR